MMQKCIMIKIGRSKKYELSKKRKFGGNRVEKFINFVE